MNIEGAIPWDMVCYLALLQLLPALVLSERRTDARMLHQFVVISQCILLLVFMIIWGGYGKDSWEYLPRFDVLTEDDAAYDSEWLFWGVGVLLGKLFYDPWPLKFLSTFAVATLCYACYFHLKDRDGLYLMVALFMLALTPSFYLLIGSAIRQGVAGAVVVMALVYLYRDRTLPFVVLSIAAFFLHHSSVVFVAAGVLSVASTRYAHYVLIAMPFIGYLVVVGGETAGVDIGAYVPHSDKVEGMFHLEKFVVAYVVAALAIILTRANPEDDKKLVGAYVYMVAFSAVFIKFEVASERFLAYSELLLPLVASVSISRINWNVRGLTVLWFCGWLAGFGLWLHPSIRETLGYAVG